MLSVASGLPLPMAVRTLAALHGLFKSPGERGLSANVAPATRYNPGRTGKRGKEKPARRPVCGLAPTFLLVFFVVTNTITNALSFKRINVITNVKESHGQIYRQRLTARQQAPRHFDKRHSRNLVASFLRPLHHTPDNSAKSLP